MSPEEIAAPFRPGSGLCSVAYIPVVIPPRFRYFFRAVFSAVPSISWLRWCSSVCLSLRSTGSVGRMAVAGVVVVVAVVEVEGPGIELKVWENAYWLVLAVSWLRWSKLLSDRNAGWKGEGALASSANQKPPQWSIRSTRRLFRSN